MKYCCLLLALSAFFGCAENTPATDPAPEAPAPVSTAAPAAEQAAPFPVYLTFAEFKHHLERETDTTYVVNFWATWCAPCVKELPYFEKLISEVDGQPVQVLLVSMDFPKDIKRKLLPFVAERNLEDHVVALADMDYDSWIDQVEPTWDGAIPFTLIYNQKGREVKFGEIDTYEDLLAFVQASR